MTRHFTAVAIAFGLAAVGVASQAHFAGRNAARDVAVQIAPPTESAPAAAGLGDREGSLYDLRVPVIGRDGQPLPLDRLRGHPVIAGMFFASCPSVCPLLIRDLKQLVAGLPPAQRARTQVLLVSFDPQRDTPQVLESVMQRHGLDAAHWTLATAKDADAAQLLAAALAIRFRPGSAGQFDHTTRVTVLDGDGHVRAQSEDMKAIAAILTDRTFSAQPSSPRNPS
jgi:protein SCO1/2